MASHDKGRILMKSKNRPLIGLGVYLAACAAFLCFCCKKYCSCCNNGCCGFGKKEE